MEVASRNGGPEKCTRLSTTIAAVKPTSHCLPYPSPRSSPASPRTHARNSIHGMIIPFLYLKVKGALQRCGHTQARLITPRLVAACHCAKRHNETMPPRLSDRQARFPGRRRVPLSTGERKRDSAPSHALRRPVVDLQSLTWPSPFRQPTGDGGCRGCVHELPHLAGDACVRSRLRGSCRYRWSPVWQGHLAPPAGGDAPHRRGEGPLIGRTSP